MSFLETVIFMSTKACPRPDGPPVKYAANLLQPPPVGREPLVERDGVALLILPVGDAGRDLPVLLLLHRHLPRRRVHNRCGRRRRSSRNLGVDLEPARKKIIY